MENKFVDGLFCNEKKDWMDANLGFTSKFIEYYKNNCDSKGNLRVVIAKSQNTGKQYAKLNDWKPQETFVRTEEGKIEVEQEEDEIDTMSIPF